MSRPTSRFTIKSLAVGAVFTGAVLAGIFGFASFASAATYYWVGTAGGNTSVATNWNTTAGACATSSNATLPTSADDVHFGGTGYCQNSATVNTTLEINNFYIDGAYSGTVTLNAPLVVAANLTISAGTLDASASGCGGSVSCNVFVAGAWSNSGTFTARTGTVYFNGTSQTVTGASTFYDLKLFPGDTVTFPASTTQTISNNFFCSGNDTSHKVTIVSSSAGTAATLSDANGADCAYISLTDITAAGGTFIAEAGSTNVSGNSGTWTFDTYSRLATLISTNLLNSGWSGGASIINSFTYNATAIPTGTTLQIQFSTDITGRQVNWFNASCAADSWTTLSVGTNVIDLSACGWTSGQFFYKILFTSDGTATPVLKSITLNYLNTFYSTNTYNTSGTLISTNLLAGKSVASIDSFVYNADITAGSGLTVQFSQDNTNWVNSSGSPGGIDTLVPGTNTISLSTLAWTTANFYYKIAFSGNGADTPVLKSITVNYNTAAFYACQSADTGNWNTAGTWTNCNSTTPQTGDTAEIMAGHTVTLDTTPTVTGVTVDATGVLATSANGITITGDLTVNGTISGATAVTVSGSSNTIYSTTGGTISAPITSAANYSANVSATYTLAISGIISGSYGINKTGLGALTLSGANTYTGTTRVSAGTLQAGVASVAGVSGAFGNNSDITLANNSAAVLNITGYATQIGSLAGGAGDGSVVLGSATLTVAGTASPAAFAGVISGTGALIKTGSGTLTLAGINTFTGGLTISQGTISVPSIANASTNQPLGNEATIALGSNGYTGIIEYTGGPGSSTMPFTLTASGFGGIQVDNATTNLTLSGVFSSTGGLTKTGAGILTLSGTNTFSGQFTVSAGTLLIATINNASANGTLGNSALPVILGSSGNTGTLEYTGATASSSKKFTMAASGTGAFIVDTNAATLTLSGIIDGSGAMTYAAAQTATPPTLTLSGANTFTGGLTIKAGTVSLTTSTSAGGGTGTGTITLGDSSANSSAVTLAGDGRTFANAIALANIATATGTLTISTTGNTTFSGAVTGTNNLTLTTAGSNTLALSGVGGNINNAGTITNTGAGTGTTTISGIISTAVTGVIQNSATSPLVLSGTNGFGTLTLGAGTTTKITHGTTTTVSNLISSGTSGSHAVLTSDDGANVGTLAKSGGGTVTVDYTNISYNAGSPSSTWIYGANCTIGSGVTGWASANTAPTGTFNSATQNTDGTGNVAVSITVDDADDNKTKALIGLSVNSNCSGTPTKATLLQSAGATATYNDTSGAPSVVNADIYQLGTTSNYQIITSSGANTVTFVWDSKTDLPSATGGTPYYLCLTVNDATTDNTITASSAIAVDNTNPTAPSSIHIASNNATTTLAKSGNTVTVTATVDAGTTVTGTIGTKATSTNGVIGTTATLTRVLDASETEGAGLDFTLVSTDNKGNSTTAVTKANIGDGSAVQTDFTSPATTDNSDTSWHADNQTITLTPLDTGGSGVAHTYYCVDTTKTCTPTTEGVSVSVTCAASNTCQQYVTYYSTDNVTNSEATKYSNLVKIDKAVPTTTADADSYTFGQTSTTAPVTVTLLCADGSGAGCLSTVYCADTSNTCSPATAYTTPVDISTEGTSYIRYYSIDSAGLTETANSKTIIISTTAYTPSNLSATSAQTSITMSWSANGNLDGASYYIENITDSTNSGWQTSASWQSTDLVCGTLYSFRVRARNIAGTSTSDYSNAVSVNTGSCGGGLGSGSSPATPWSQTPVIEQIIQTTQTVAQVPQQIAQTITNMITTFLPSPAESQVVYPPIGEAVPVEAPVALQGWNIMEVKPISELSLTPVKTDIAFFADKIPQFKQTLAAFGIDVNNLTSVQKVSGTELYLPGLTRVALSQTEILAINKFESLPQTPGVNEISTPGVGMPGQISAPEVVGGTGGTKGVAQPGELAINKFAAVQGVPIADMSSSAKQKIPTDIVFVRFGGGLIDYSMAISVDKLGQVSQKINTIAGKTMELVIKPDQPAKTVTGFITLNKVAIGKEPVNVLGYITKILTASLINTQGNPPSPEATSGQSALLLTKFAYVEITPGIYKASVNAPKTEGEYDISTIIQYKDINIAPKETKMTAIVNPEGYVYSQQPDGRLRIEGASVSLYWLNPDTKQYELWPADKFLQKNPILTDDTGKYSFLVPEGTYKLKATIRNYSIFESEPFAMKEDIAVNKDIELFKKIGWFSWLNWQAVLTILLAILIGYNIWQKVASKKINN